MSNCLIARRNILYTRQNRYLSRTLLFILGISNIIFSPVTNAQAPPLGSSHGLLRLEKTESAVTVGNSAPNFSSNQPSNIQPIQQPGSFSDSNSGSQQFFQQGREQLYFLPEEKSEPILQIDEDLEENAEGAEEGALKDIPWDQGSDNKE